MLSGAIPDCVLDVWTLTKLSLPDSQAFPCKSSPSLIGRVQTMVADAHSLQFKLPPPNVPLPACRTNPAVASGAPLVEVLVVTSVWCIQLLKLLCQVCMGLAQLHVPFGQVRWH